jgi:hypothetical protein
LRFLAHVSGSPKSFFSSGIKNGDGSTPSLDNLVETLQRDAKLLGDLNQRVTSRMSRTDRGISFG